MESSAKKRTLAVAVAAILLLWLADEYPALRFRGDASFSGGPVFGYSIKMRRIPFYRPGEYVYHLRGLPNEEMSLQLYTEGKSFVNEAEITRISTNIEASLADQAGRIVCQANGSPLIGTSKIDDRYPRGWITMLSSDEAAYWNRNCIRMALIPSDSYTLTIRIQNVDPNAPKIDLIPTLEGGQLDMP